MGRSSWKACFDGRCEFRPIGAKEIESRKRWVATGNGGLVGVEMECNDRMVRVQGWVTSDPFASR